MAEAATQGGVEDCAPLLADAGLPGFFEDEDFIGALPDSDLLDALRRLAEARRALDCGNARIAAEIARRSQADDETSLARRCGERDAVALVAKETGGSMGAARALVDVGGSSLPGEP